MEAQQRHVAGALPQGSAAPQQQQGVPGAVPQDRAGLVAAPVARLAHSKVCTGGRRVTLQGQALRRVEGCKRRRRCRRKLPPCSGHAAPCTLGHAHLAGVNGAVPAAPCHHTQCRPSFSCPALTRQVSAALRKLRRAHPSDLTISDLAATRHANAAYWEHLRRIVAGGDAADVAVGAAQQPPGGAGWRCMSHALEGLSRGT